MEGAVPQSHSNMSRNANIISTIVMVHKINVICGDGVRPSERNYMIYFGGSELNYVNLERTRGLVASGPHFILVGPVGPYFMYVTSHPLNPKIELARPMSFHPSIYATRCPPCAGRCDTKLGPRRFLSAVEMADNSSGVKSHLPNVGAVEEGLEVEDEDILP